MRAELRPSRSDDIRALLGLDILPHRIKALTATIDGRPVGLGGLVFRPDGVWASLVIDPADARRIKITLMRGVRRIFADAQRAGIRRIYAEAAAMIPGSVGFLTRLGFEPIEHNGRVIYVWEPSAHVE